MKRPLHFWLAWLLTVTGLPAAAHAQSCNIPDRSVLLILDASGSMNARLPNGQTRMAVAQRAIRDVAQLVPAKTQLALRIYGAQSPSRQKNCQDTQLAVPFGPASDASAPIAARVGATKAQGYTPIAYSLNQVGSDFPADAKERVVVLVSDGKETCQGDPVIAARALAAKGIVVHTVGFIVDTAARMQLQNIARATGGRYFDAPVGPELPDTLKSALNACREVVKAPAKPQPGRLRTALGGGNHNVFDAETGKRVDNLSKVRLEIKLPAGIYEVQFGPARWKGIEVRSGETTIIEPALLRLQHRVQQVVVLDSETQERFGSVDAANAEIVVVPGVYDLVFGKDLRWPFVKLDAGRRTLDPPRITVDSAVKWSKRARVLNAEGLQVWRFDNVNRRVVLPPGDYVVEIDDRRIPFAGSEGQLLEIQPQ
jgi:hypothetical protein